MLSSAAGALARRGLEVATSGNNLFSFEAQPEETYQLPAWGIVIVGSTFLVYFFALSMVEYTFGRLIPTLLMIESPAENITFEPLPTEDTDASLTKTPELYTAKPRPITSSFRSSIKLLQSKGGFRARFRGISVYIVNSIVVQWVYRSLSAVPYFPKPLAAIAGMVLCAQLSLAWTLIVISEPSPKTWFRRLPSRAMWKKVAIPTAILALAEQVALVVPFYVAVAIGLTKEDPRQMADIMSHHSGIIICKSVGVFAIAAVLAFILVIPAGVALTRVQASLISETEETIVPFDRSFNGKVVPEIIGGSGVIGMFDAWRTFDWAARIRLVKAYVKVFAMQTAISIVFMVVMVLQLFIIAGDDLKKLAPQDPSDETHVALI